MTLPSQTRYRLRQAFEMTQRSMGIPDDSLAGLEDDQLDRAAKYASDKCSRLVGVSLVMNAKKVLKRRTGDLESFLSKSILRAKWDSSGKMVRMYIALPIQNVVENGKVGQAHKTAAYVKAVALSYGAVRTPLAMRDVREYGSGDITGAKRKSAVGASAKRTLKKKIFGAKLSGNASKAYEKKFGYSDAIKNKSGSFTMRGSGTTVVPPRPYLFLDGRQANAIGEHFIRYFKEAIAKENSHGS